MGVMTVICKWCGAKNEKEQSQYVVICPKCGKKTSYMVQPFRRV